MSPVALLAQARNGALARATLATCDSRPSSDEFAQTTSSGSRRPVPPGTTSGPPTSSGWGRSAPAPPGGTTSSRRTRASTTASPRSCTSSTATPSGRSPRPTPTLYASYFPRPTGHPGRRVVTRVPRPLLGAPVPPPGGARHPRAGAAPRSGRALRVGRRAPERDPALGRGVGERGVPVGAVRQPARAPAAGPSRPSRCSCSSSSGA